MKLKLKPINQQVVVVFGASSGIGRETALRFAAKGAKVVVAARGEAGLRTLIDQIRGAGGEALAIVADTSDFAQVQAVADLTVAQYGRLDTWVHAAAVSVYAPFTQTTPREFAQVIDVNLTGQAFGAMVALPYLRQNGGALIHISSVEAKRPLPLHSAYAASKHGIHGFVETLRMELNHDKAPVSVTEILPASINTPFFNHARTKTGVKPMGAPPIYEPGIVADAILYAAAHPVREMIVGGAGKAMVASQRVSSRLTDALFTRVGFAAQETDEPKSEAAPNDLYGPNTGDNRARGDFGPQSKSKSVDTWFGTHPLARAALFGTLLARAGLLAARKRGASAGTVSDAPSTMEVADMEVVLVETVSLAPVESSEVTPVQSTDHATVIAGSDVQAGEASAVNVVTGAPETDPEATVRVVLDRPAPEVKR